MWATTWCAPLLGGLLCCCWGAPGLRLLLLLPPRGQERFAARRHPTSRRRSWPRAPPPPACHPPSTAQVLQAAKGEVAVAVGELMEAAGMAEVLPLPKARVPVVKFVVPATGTKVRPAAAGAGWLWKHACCTTLLGLQHARGCQRAWRGRCSACTPSPRSRTRPNHLPACPPSCRRQVDVTVNNILACVNTKLLADYCAIDARLAPLVALVKHWAKQRAVNDPYRGTLSSYCYVLMCIHLLQTRPKPVLPPLQQLPPTFRRAVGQWTCEFCDDVSRAGGFGGA